MLSNLINVTEITSTKHNPVNIPMHNHPTIDGSGVRLGDRTLAIPGYKLERELGRGANAAVFEALDEALNRKVAIKIWNGRGLQRAQLEATKIANMSHPCIVSTYYFGRIEEHPYCVMELVRGVSGKAWLKQGQPIADRLALWDIYSGALQYIHNSGSIHGDPHLGNILVGGSSQSGVKLADTGTSEFWTDHAEIEAREANLIRETAERLFYKENFTRLWRLPAGLNYKDTLATLQVLSTYLRRVYDTQPDWDRRAENASILADLIVEKPFFDLDVVLSQVEQSGITTADRLSRRLNATLLRIHNILDASEELDQKAIDLYAKAAQTSIGLLTKAT